MIIFIDSKFFIIYFTNLIFPLIQLLSRDNIIKKKGRLKTIEPGLQNHDKTNFAKLILWRNIITFVIVIL